MVVTGCPTKLLVIEGRFTPPLIISSWALASITIPEFRHYNSLINKSTIIDIEPNLLTLLKTRTGVLHHGAMNALRCILNPLKFRESYTKKVYNPEQGSKSYTKKVYNPYRAVRANEATAPLVVSAQECSNSVNYGNYILFKQ